MRHILFVASLISIVAALCIGFTVGFNTNKLTFLEAITYESPSYQSVTVGTNELSFVKFPVQIVYAQGTDSGSEIKVETAIFTAMGDFVVYLSPTITTKPGEAVVTTGLEIFRFQAFIAKSDSGIYTSAVTVNHPDQGSIQLNDGEIKSLTGSQKQKEELKKVAETILKKL